MISVLFVLFSAIFFMLASGAVLSHLFRQEITITRRTASYSAMEEGKMKRDMKNGNEQMKTSLDPLKRAVDKMKLLIDQRTSTARRKKLEQRLHEAGYPLGLSPTDFQFLQLLVGFVLFFIISLLLVRTGTNIFSSLLMGFVIGAFGLYYPSFYLSVVIKKRRLTIKKMLPDFFDMVNLSIEAGMGLDASLLRVCNQTKGPLAEEFLQTLEDMKLGKSRREAFAELRRRVPVHQFQSIITSLIQADILGVGMAKVIRSLTSRIREQRTLLAREQAMKAPVKMVFPMLLFIFPAIFIVMLGPLIIYLIQSVL